jgi:hypothetical protein
MPSARTYAYALLAVLILVFILDLIRNGKILQSPKFLKKELRKAYQVFFQLFVLTAFIGATLFIGIWLFVKPEINNYPLLIGAVTFSSIFSRLSFSAAGSSSEANLKQTLAVAGRYFFISTLNFCFLLCFRYVYVHSIAPIIRHGAERCPIHVLELMAQATILLMSGIFLFCGVAAFCFALHKIVWCDQFYKMK